MFDWFCCKNNNTRKIFPENNYSWYVKPEEFSKGRKQFLQQLILYDAKRNINEFNNWIHTKVKSKNIDDILAHLDQTNSNYIDDDFPHSLYSISKQPIQVANIEWKRVTQIVKNPIFIKKHGISIKSIEKYQTNNKAFRNSLILMGRCHPQKLNRILAHKTSQRGIYQFKLFKKGIIHNVIIDDYIPTVNKMELYSGPCDDNQIYPILLEKAIAKLSGSYSQMPSSPLKIMEMIYCGAVMKQELADLTEIKQVQKTICSSLQMNRLIIVTAKDHQNIRKSGINPNQIYHIINYHKIMVEDYEQTVIEILSENKMSAWNGSFNIIDPIWKNVDEKVRIALLKQMQLNQSFCMPSKQLNKLFKNAIIFKDTDSYNKQWFQHYSQKNTITFSTFTLSESDNIFLRVHTSYTINQSLIIAKEINNGCKYQYIGGSSNQNAECLDFMKVLEPGKYCIGVIHDWQHKQQGQYTVYLSSGTKAAIQNCSKIPINFIEQICLDHDKSSKTKQISYSFIKQIGIGYIRVGLDSDEQEQPIRKLRIQKKELQRNDWRLIEKFENCQQIIIGRKPMIFAIFAEANCFDPEHNFPLEAFRVEGEDFE